MKEYKIGDIVNGREIVCNTISEMAERNPDIWVLTSDCGGNMNPFVKKFGDRFVDTGIAEQNAAGISAGLAISGSIPYIVGMAPFVTMRCFEQNRSSISYQNLPVRIIGWVGGMASCGGSTHYAMEDISIMRSIANMQVVSISDPLMLRSILLQSEKISGPMYIRLTLAKSDPVIYEPAKYNYEFGKGLIAREGSDCTIIAHGGMAGRALQVADTLAAEGISIRVVDMYSIKPLDKELLFDSIRKTEKIIVWEDHFKNGGLSSAIADCMTDEGIFAKTFIRVGIPETYPGFGPYNELLEKYHMDPEYIIDIIRNLMKGE